MQIRLADGITMWFLGEPKNLIVNLNFVNRGPVEVDFAALSDVNQNRLINAVRSKQLESDISVEDLITLKRKPNVTAATYPASTVDESTVTSSPPQVVKTLDFLKQEMETKKLERCQFILRGSVRSIKVAVSEANDITLTKALIKMEESNRARKSVLTFLREKLQALETAVVKFAEKEKAKAERQTEEYDVIESDQKVVSLSPEELIEAGYQM